MAITVATHVMVMLVIILIRQLAIHAINIIAIAVQANNGEVYEVYS